MEEITKKQKKLLEKWKKWLESEEGLKVMHNVAMDMFVMGKDEKLEGLEKNEM